MSTANHKITDLRTQIDQINSELKMLLLKRAQLSDEILEVKKINQLPIRDLEREEKMLADLIKNENDQLLKEYLRSIFTQIFFSSSSLMQSRASIHKSEKK